MRTKSWMPMIALSFVAACGDDAMQIDDVVPVPDQRWLDSTPIDEVLRKAPVPALNATRGRALEPHLTPAFIELTDGEHVKFRVYPAPVVVERPFPETVLTQDARPKPVGTWRVREAEGCGDVTADGEYYTWRALPGICHVEHVMKSGQVLVAEVRVRKQMAVPSPGTGSLVLDGDTLYAAFERSECVRKIDLNRGVASTLIGKCRAEWSFVSDTVARDGAGTDARFNLPQAMVFDAVHRKLYVGDSSGAREIDLDNGATVTTLPDPDGLFRRLRSLAFDEGALYFVGTYRAELRRYDLATQSSTWFNNSGLFAGGIIAGPDGGLFVSDFSSITVPSRILSMDSSGRNVQELPLNLHLIPNGFEFEGSPPGVYPFAMAFANDGRLLFGSHGLLFAADLETYEVERLAGSRHSHTAESIVVHANGNVYLLTAEGIMVLRPGQTELERLRIIDLDLDP